MASDELELEAFLPYRLSVLANTVSRAIANLYSERFGLTVPEWRVIAVLGGSPGLSAGEVAQRTAMDKVAVSRAVHGLIKRNRVSRQMSDVDRRRSSLTLTEEGQTVYSRVVPMARELEGRLLAALDEAEAGTLDSLLAKLQQRAETLR